MIVQDILAHCQETGVKLALGPEGQLRVSPPPKLLSEDLRENLTYHKQEILDLLAESPTSPQPQKTACYFCDILEEVWEVNRGTCWAKRVCQGCQTKLGMPTPHLCDPSLPLTATCEGGDPRSWICPKCEAEVEIESVEEVDGRTLTFWSCPKACTVGVTPTGVRQPPMMVSKVVQ